MNIAFYLPGATNVVSGGYKVIYTYANLLNRKGHTVTILYGSHNLRGVPFLYGIRPLRKRLIEWVFGKKPKWFELDDGVKVRYLLDGLKESDAAGLDALIATAADTAEDVAALKHVRAKKCYFVQDFENWKIKDAEVIKTYRLGLSMITVSQYMKNCIRKYAWEEAAVVENAIDLETFRVVNPICRRNPCTVSMLYHKLPNKGSIFGIRALVKLKKEFPELDATVFGTSKRPQELPGWITYRKNAAKEQLADIYNHSALFLCPVIHEGFGLTGAESMACGCALVSTDYEAGKEFAEHGQNALLCETGSAGKLFENAKRCILDDQLRIRLASQGAEDVKRMTWERALEKFERELVS